MASEDKISSYIDLAALKAETDAALKEIDRLREARDEITKTKADLKIAINSKEVVEASNASATSVKNLTKAQQEATKATIDAQKAIQAKLKTDQEAEKLAQQRLKTEKAKSDQSSKTVADGKREQKATEDLANDYKQLNLALKDAEDRYKSLALQGKGNTPAGQEALATAKGFRAQLDEVDQALGNHQRNVGNYASAFTGYANTLRGLRGPTKLLGEALGLGAQEADQFRIVLEHSFQGIAAFFRGKEAKAAATAADTASNVANSASQTANTAATEAGAVAQTELAVATTSASTAMTIFRYALLATGIGVIIGLIALVVVRYKEWIKSIDETTESQKILSKALEESSFTDAINNVNKLADNIKLAKEGFISKSEVLKEYNDTIGKTTGEVKTLDEAETALVKNGPAYIQMLYYQAAAHIALESSAKKAVEAEQIRQKKLEQFTSFTDAQNNFNIKSADEADRAKARIAKNEETRRKKEADEKQKGAEEDLKLFNTFNERAAKISKENSFDFFGGDEDEKAKKEKHIKDASDAIAELRKELAAIQGKQTLGELAPKEADIDRVKAYDKAFEDIFKRGGKTDSAIVLGLRIEMLPINERVLHQQITDLANSLKPGKVEIPNFADDDKRQRLEITKNATEAMQKFIDAEDDAYAKELENITKNFDAKKLKNKDNATQLIKIEGEYQEELTSLQARHNRTQITNSLELADAIVKDLKYKNFTVLDEEKKLSEARARLASADAKAQEDANAKIKKSAEDLIRDKKDLRAKEGELARDLGGLAASLVDDQYEREKNQIQQTIVLNEKKYSEEIQGIANSNLSQQDKTAATIQAKAQEDAQNTQLKQRQKEIDIKKAQFDRAIQIAQITGTAIQSAVAMEAKAAEATAQGALLASNPLTAAYAPIAFAAAATIQAEVPIIAAIAGAQIAKLLSAPITAYAEGVDNLQKPGWGLFGEAGAELVHIPGIKPFIADSPTVGFLPAGTSITPIGTDELNSVVYRSMIKQTGNMIQTEKENNNLMKELISVMKTNKQQVGINVTGNNNFKEWKVWVDKNTNW